MNKQTNQQTSPHHHSIDDHNPLYPRRGLLKYLRTILLLCWSIIILYLSNAGWNLYQLAHTDFTKLTNYYAVSAALLLPGPLADPSTPRWVFATLFIIFLLFLGCCIWATRDARYEREVIHARDIRQRVQKELQGKEINNQLLKEQEPPFDEILLHLPEHFVGRIADLRWLIERLSRSGITRVTALCGMGGIGKTALVAVAVHQLRNDGHFRDGIVVVSCQELTDATEVLLRVLTRFDPQRRQLEDIDLNGLDKVALKLLEGKDVLIVLDNIEPKLTIEDVVIPLRTVKATILLTSRHMLSRATVDLEGSRALDLLSPQEALDLFALSLGKSIATLSSIERVEAERIVSTLDRHTLAVKLAGAYAAGLKRDLRVLANELENAEHAIELNDGGTPRAIVKVFAKSIEALPYDARRLFTALAAFPTMEFGRQATIALARELNLTKPSSNVDLLVLRTLLEAYTNESMPRESDRERLRLHPLLRAYAENRSKRWALKNRFLASSALAKYYVNYSSQLSDVAIAVDEYNITGALKWANESKQNELVVALCLCMRQFWSNRWRTEACQSFLPWGIKAAKEVAKITNERVDRLRLADLSLTHGQVLRRIGRLEEAEQFFRTNLAIRREVMDQQGESDVLSSLGELAWRKGDLNEAKLYFGEALVITKQIHDRRSEGKLLRHMGEFAKENGVLEEAIQYFEEALAIAREVHNRREEGWIIDLLGRIALQRGRLKEAINYFEGALAVAREVQNRREESTVIAALGQVAVRQGQLKKAEHYFQEALVIAREVQEHLIEGWILRLMGQFAQQGEHLEKARSYYQSALKIAREQNRREEGWILGNLGELAHQLGQMQEAEQYFNLALGKAKEVHNRQGEGWTLWNMGKLAQSLGQVEKAEEYYRQGIEILLGVQDNIIYIKAKIDLGKLLITRQNKHEEGCSVLMEAITLQHELGLIGEEETRELAQYLGCNNGG